MVLYRKYRPQKFSEVVGQDHIKKILTNSIKEEKVAHAYLFSGPRGVGKTTIARLLAKSLNCQNRKKDDAEPCGECSSCKEVTDDRNLDVIEIDAASNRGIDEIRQLRDKIRFSPTKSRYKVYIIDEVHMLTREAFNALLKTLEEPPKHAIFIMATTELHKVPDTIISRSCQLDFKKASNVELISSLENVCKKEKIQFDRSALEVIAESASGGFRDALSLLGQVISATDGKVGVDVTNEILGLPPKELVLKFSENLITKNSAELFEIINQVSANGYDFDQFINLTIDELRKNLIETQNKEIFDLIKMLFQAKQNLKISPVDQLSLELLVVELCGETITERLPQKTQITENKETKELKNNKAIEQFNIETQEHINTKTSKTKNSNTEENARINVNKITIEVVKSKWPEIRKELSQENHSLAMILAEAIPTDISENKIQLSISNEFYADKLKQPKKYQIVSSAIEKVIGAPLGFECVIETGKQNKKSNDAMDVAKEVFDL